MSQQSKYLSNGEISTLKEYLKIGKTLKVNSFSNFIESQINKNGPEHAVEATELQMMDVLIDMLVNERKLR